MLLHIEAILKKSIRLD